MLDVLDRDGNEYWVILPPDQNGTRRVGWINGALLDPGAAQQAALRPMAVPDSAASSGQAPQTPRNAPPRRNYAKWQVQAIGGLTFGSSTSELFGGGAGIALSRSLLVTVEAGAVGDVTSDGMREHIEDVAARTQQMLSGVTGRRFDVVGEASMPAFYGIAGLRFTAPRVSRSRPFVSGHTGFATVDPEVRLLINGDDRSSSFLPAADIPSSRTRLLLGGGAGLTIRMTNAMSVDVGYRYSRIFVDDGVNLNRVYAALGFGF
jgi:opacity protein-like surface antigen